MNTAGEKQRNRRVWADFASISAKTLTGALLTLVCATPLLVEPVCVSAQSPATTTAATKPPADPGTPFYEVMHGTGVATGYVLAHNGLLTDSVVVQVGGQQLKSPRDYVVDSALGTLRFILPVGSAETIRVSYRYHDPVAWQQELLGIPRLDLGKDFTPTIHLFAADPTPTTDGKAALPSYGLSWNGGSGWKNGSNYGGIVFFSGAPYSAPSHLSLGDDSSQSGKSLAPTKGDSQFILQNVVMRKGALNAYANYQDVGKGFTDFAALKQNGVANATALSALEKEKGVRRFGYGLGLNFDPNARSAGGLTLDWNQIMDHDGVISQKTADLATGAFKFHYGTQEISDKFGLFQNLRESEKDAWAHQKGMQTSTLGAGFQLGPAGRSKTPGALGFLSQKFNDTSGGLQRNVWNLQEGNFSALMLNRNSNAGFKRLADLADADKTTLALDLYQAYDPKARAEQVTANDKTQVTREAGLVRDALRIGEAFSATGGVSFSQLRVQNSKLADGKADGSGFSRNDISLATSGFHFNITDRATDAKFARLTDLADVEKNYLALDIRKEFDPNATLTQVTQKERDQVATEVGISRSIMDGGVRLGKEGNLLFSQAHLNFTAADPTAGGPTGPVERENLVLSIRKLQVAFTSQSIADNFTHLTSLSDIEKAQFANEHGLKHDLLSLNYQVNKATKIGFSRLNLQATEDAVQSAVEAAKKNGTDPAAAALLARAEAYRQNLSFETKGITLVSNWADTDKAFARSADLALADADKKQIEAERGYKRNDLTLHVSLIKNLLLDSTTYNAVDATDHTSHDTYKQTAQYTPNKKTSVSYQQDGDVTSVTGEKSGLNHRLLTLSQNVGYGILFNLFNESSVTLDKGAIKQGIKTNGMHLETAQNKSLAVKYDAKRVAYDDGKYEYTNTLNIHAKPSKGFSITYDKLDVDRSHDEISETTDKVGIEWQATKQFAVVGGFSEKETTDVKGANNVTVGLKGEPMKNVTLAASFDEVHNVSANTKDVADVSICNAKPFQLGPLQNLTITARYASLNDQRKLQNETMTGRASWSLWKNQFVLDYGGVTNPDQTTAIARTYSFTTDTNASRWFHGSFYYKDRTLLTNEQVAIRRFTGDARLTHRDHIVYTYGTMPEDEKGNILRQSTEDVSFKHTISVRRSLSLFYRFSDNQTTKLLTRALGFSYAIVLDGANKMDVGYSRDACGTPKTYYQSNHFRLGFDHPIGEGRVLTVSADLHMNEGAHTELEGHFDITKKF